jgi:diguanylate cyclase (GGDEF)-like protein
VRASTSATSLRFRLATALAVVLIGPLLAAVVAFGLLAPRAARSAAEQTARHDASGAAVALAASCQAIGNAATATAGEVQAYATKYGSLSASTAAAAVRRAAGHHPEVAIAVFDQHSRLLAVGGSRAGRGPAAAGGYGASCSNGRSGDLTGDAGLAERREVRTSAAGSVAWVLFWMPLDGAALHSLRAELGTDGQLSLLTGTGPADRAAVLASTAAPVDRRRLGELLRSAGAGTSAGAGPDLGYAVRPAAPGVPFRVLASYPVHGAGLLPELAVAALALTLLTLLPIRLLAGRLSRPVAEELRSTAGELRSSRAALADSFDRFGEALQNTHNLDRLLSTVTAACLPGTGAVAGIILLVEDGAEQPSGLEPRGRACLPGSLAERAVVELPLFADRYFRSLPDTADPQPLHSRLRGAGPVIAVPIRSGGRAIGVLALARGEGAEAFEALVLPRVRALADDAGTAIVNVRVHEETRRLSVTDALTGVGNVRQLSATLSREIAGATRFGRPLTVLMLDLDHFKLVNDALGHAFGDVVLREFARRLLTVFREMDTVARYGGEEFAVVLPETDIEGGCRAAERVIEVVRAEPFRHGELRRSVTVSIGVAAFPRHGRTAAELLQAADAALYAAKGEGRDRWEVARISPSASTVSQAG